MKGIPPVVIRAVVDVFMAVADCADSHSSPGTKIDDAEFVARVRVAYREAMQRPEVLEFYGRLVEGDRL